ncbi:hypothetical protein VMCG_07923 [Cytospora schulzeri]|uniref:Uncharacterized protein n=1 Tax=Cytospora schulzeri TaxID=448051 RepID=A0A423W0L6_9PEZI|nr:hypothetical protein VMCG_07923 [Valsa malicola]
MRLVYTLSALGLLVGHVLSQQWGEMEGVPDLSRRIFYEAFAHPPSLAKRDGDCGTDQHPCSDINSTSCCPNTDYCIVNETTYEPFCCPLGSTCGQSCHTDAYYSKITTTTTKSSKPTVETVFACVGRKCINTNYLCAESFGGGCCPYDADCASGGNCLVPSTSSSSLAISTIVSEIPAGCSIQGQTSCTIGGGGCCDSGYTCTQVSSQAMCARASSTSTTTFVTPTASGVTVEHTSQGLSTGAKAGIAVGVIVAAALITGALTWLFIRRRASGRSTTTGQEMRSGIGGGGPDGPHEADGHGQGYGFSPRAAYQRRGSGQVMSETGYAPSSTHMTSRSGGTLPGLTSDYFGAAAGRGPYSTDRPGETTTTPEYLAQPVRADGQTPHGPGDIVGPVEIGGGGSVKEKDGRPRLPSQTGSSEGAGSELDGTGTMVAVGARQQTMPISPVRESIAGLFELYGSEVVPVVEGGGGTVNTRAPQPLGTPGSELASGVM